jgi:GNAT superfamily N-acetyltransferase
VLEGFDGLAPFAPAQPARTDPAYAGAVTAEQLRYRRASPDDSRACHDLMWTSVVDLGTRLGSPLQGTADDWWRSGESLHRLLAQLAAEWWLAEETDSGRLVGFARTIEREGLVELTEFFVLPQAQGRGIGRELLERAFPAGAGTVRSIVATSDVRAQARYYTAGTVARFPIYTLAAAIGEAGTAWGGGVAAVPIDDARAIEKQRAIERQVLGHRRSDEEMRWLLEHRRAHLYQRDGETIGFSFVGGDGVGPVAALAPSELPAILLHVEGVARSIGLERIEIQVPAPNEVAIRHLMGRGYHFDAWINFLMSDSPFGRFDRFVPFGPPMFL